VLAEATVGGQGDVCERKRGETGWLRKLRWGVELWRGCLADEGPSQRQIRAGPGMQVR
jgi:hypothetical protein